MTQYIETERLVLRTWQEEDLEPFAAINADPKVMEFFPALKTLDETRTMMQAINETIQERGFGLFAGERKDTGELIGFVGLNIPSFDAHFTPCVEIGWRLGVSYWGQGFAFEAAKAVLAFGFQEKQLNEIVAFTTPKNKRSIRLMERLGMRRDEFGDFHIPKLPSDHPLSLHVLYRLQNPT